MFRARRTRFVRVAAMCGLFALLSAHCWGQEGSQTSSPINNADTAWLLISGALAMLMTAPGLALFYGGLVRRKNVLP